ncbi:MULTISPECIES: hypothetical protein [Cupriavidus]|nr:MULTISPECIES: hypothetical protein [Cupriavidus]BDB30521.1 hypothetical protein CTP10_R79380 [Cupriavidus sp. P-10]
MPRLVAHPDERIMPPICAGDADIERLQRSEVVPAKDFEKGVLKALAQLNSFEDLDGGLLLRPGSGLIGNAIPIA